MGGCCSSEDSGETDPILKQGQQQQQQQQQGSVAFPSSPSSKYTPVTKPPGQKRTKSVKTVASRESADGDDVEDEEEPTEGIKRSSSMTRSKKKMAGLKSANKTSSQKSGLSNTSDNKKLTNPSGEEGEDLLDKKSRSKTKSSKIKKSESNEGYGDDEKEDDNNEVENDLNDSASISSESMSRSNRGGDTDSDTMSTNSTTAVKTPSKTSKTSTKKKTKKLNPKAMNNDTLDLPDVKETMNLMEFFKGMDLTKQQVAEMKEIFDFCDSDKNGRIDKKELYSLIKRLNIKMNKKEFEHLFTSLDTNKSGDLSFQEFIGGMTWLKKGSTFNQVEETDEMSKEKAVEVLEKYVDLLVQTGIQRADLLMSTKDKETAAAIIRTIDCTLVEKMSQALGHNLISESNLKKFNELKKKTKESKLENQ